MKWLKYLSIFATGAIVGAFVLIYVVRLKPSLLFPQLEQISKTAEKVEELYGDLGDKKEKLHDQFNEMFNKDFFSGKDPFAEMRKMREQMTERFKRFGTEGDSENPFDDWYEQKFGGGTIEDIQMREDESYIYYDVVVEDLQSTSVSAKIENEMIEITGKVKKTEGGSVFSSTFTRVIPLPQNVDAKDMEMLPGEGKFILKFKKLQI